VFNRYVGICRLAKEQQRYPDTVSLYIYRKRGNASRGKGTARNNARREKHNPRTAMRSARVTQLGEHAERHLVPAPRRERETMEYSSAGLCDAFSALSFVSPPVRRNKWRCNIQIHLAYLSLARRAAFLPWKELLFRTRIVIRWGHRGISAEYSIPAGDKFIIISISPSVACESSWRNCPRDVYEYTCIQKV